MMTRTMTLLSAMTSMIRIWRSIGSSGKSLSLGMNVASAIKFVRSCDARTVTYRLVRTVRTNIADLLRHPKLDLFALLAK